MLHQTDTERKIPYIMGIYPTRSAGVDETVNHVVRTCALNISSMQIEMNESPALKSLRQAGIGLNVSQCDSCSNTYVSPTKH